MFRYFVVVKSKKGFTLVELMIVVAVMAILVAIAAPVYFAASDNAGKRTCRYNMKTLEGMLSNYMMGIYSNDTKQTIPDMIIANNEGIPVFSVHNGSDAQAVTAMGTWITGQYQVVKGSCCCTSDSGVITVTAIGNAVRITCSIHTN